MSTFKKTKVVMLPTNEKANMALIGVGNRVKLFEHPKAEYELSKTIQPQHLYFLSDEEIKEGDWVYNEISKEIYQFKENRVDYEKKIIATTDKSLKDYGKGVDKIMNTFNDTFADYLPQPSTSFIEKFVEEYNKGNVITEILVEYHEDIYFQDELQARGKLKINPKDNTITIRKAKDSWSREEVKVILEKAICERDQFLNKSGTLSYNFDKWIEENL